MRVARGRSEWLLSFLRVFPAPALIARLTGIKRNAQSKVARLVFGKKAEAEKRCRLIDWSLADADWDGRIGRKPPILFGVPDGI